MTITVPTRALESTLKLVERIVAQQVVLPIMAHALAVASDGALRLSTTNLELSVTTQCPATVTTPGAFTVPVKRLLAVIKQISADTITLTRERVHVVLTAGSYTLKLPTCNINDFPSLPTVEAGGMLLDGRAFTTMIRKVRHAISESDRRYFMAGALFSVTETLTALVTTDGKRLALTTAPLETANEPLEILIPTNTLDLLLADGENDAWLFTYTTNHLFFVSSRGIISSRRIEGNFPNYQRVIPRDNTRVVQLPRAALLAAIKRVSVSANDERAIVFTLGGNTLAINASNYDVGEGREVLTLDTIHDTLIAFTINCDYVYDFLHRATSDTITLSLKDAMSATLWTDGDDYLNVIMTMRL